ncbi:MAG TPA: HEPN domain-containing protein [Thermoanaerobaculia bacterium]
MNRFDLQKMAEERVADAAALLDAGRFQAAYYLCGYAVECALKACIARKVREFDFPDRKVVNDSYVHDVGKLLNISGLTHQNEEESSGNLVFAKNWTLVKDWSEASRYDTSITESAAIALVRAVTDPTDGVLTWLKKHW